MLTGIHFILTYQCNLECDHCFVYGSPSSEGTFTIGKVKKVFHEVEKMGTIEWVYFEGGEPFLFYPLMLEGIRIAHDIGFKVGIVTNSYWARSEEDAELWLKPISELGVADLSLSDDSFHSKDEKEGLSKHALKAAGKLAIPADIICIDRPEVGVNKGKERVPGEPVVGGGVMFRGRAVAKLTGGLPTKRWHDFTECLYEDLRHPKRVHLDTYGNVHLCQGLSMGNMWQTPLSELVKNFDCDSHPICRPLARGGPALLAGEYNVKHDKRYVDSCHFCYLTRLALLDKFPEYLVPMQVYGLGSDDSPV